MLCALLLLLFRRRPQGRLLFAAGLFFFLGAGRLLLATPAFDAHSVASYNDKGDLRVQGVVIERPAQEGAHQRVRIRASRLWVRDAEHEVEGDLLAFLPAYPAYHYGDELLLEGRLSTPARQGDFDYGAYLARQGIYSTMSWPRTQLVAQGQGQPLPAFLNRLKDRLVEVLRASLPPEHAGMLAAMLLGEAAGVPEALEAAMRASGTSHIMVISGWNVTLLAGILLSVLTPLMGRRRAMWSALLAIAGYTLLVGFDAPVVRAAIMGALAILALLAGRRALALNSLAIAAFLMTLIQPHSLWDIGFQLSCAATIGIITLHPHLQRGVERLLAHMGAAGGLGIVRALDEFLLVTVAAQAWAVPLILYHIGKLSLVTLPANVLVLPAQAPLLGFGALSLLAGLIWPPLGQLAGWLAWPFAAYTVAVVEGFAGLPWAEIPAPPLSPALLAVYYLLLIAITALLGLPAERRKELAFRARRLAPASMAFAPLGLALVLVWTAVFQAPDGYLHIYFLDVGQGDAIFLRTPSGRHILIDGGADGRTALQQVGRRMPFWERRLDVVMATHDDSDHIGGLIDVLDAYRVDMAMDPGLNPDDSELAKRWLEGVDGAGAERVPASRGMRLLITPEDLALEVVHPPADCAAEDIGTNNCSLAVRVRYGACDVLLMADVERAGEKMMLREGGDFHADVLKVSHHGAAGGTSEHLLDTVSPALAVISVGAGNPFGHPAVPTLRRLEGRAIQVWRTDEDGTLELICDGEKLWMRGRR